MPIDIHYNKLLDWLLSRRHCSQNWQQVVLTIREKINNAIQDMPAVEDVANLLHGAYINYFHCVEIMRLLKLTEDNSRNIFGRYSSQRLKDWADILKLYEKDDVYLADAAQLLARNVNYEIPTLKRQIAKCIQAQQDYLRKETEHAKAAADLRENYHAACKQMGIEGKKIKRELLQLVRDLPTTYDSVANLMKSLQPAIQYYTNFVAFILSRCDAPSEQLPLVRYVIDNGNVTVFEWRTKRKPTKLESTLDGNFVVVDDDDDAESGDNADKKSEIDWGDLGGESAEIENISAMVTEEVLLTENEIDWSTVDDLNSGIEIEVTGDKNHQVDLVTECTDEDVARGVDTLTVMDHTATRNDILNELMELESFLEQRLGEMSSDSSDDVLAAVIIQMAPSTVHVDIQTVSNMLSSVSGILSLLTSQRMRDLMLIRSSPRYVDRLSANLRKLTSDADKMASLSRLMSTRHDEAIAEQRRLEPQLELVQQRTKQLQKQIEGEISKRYKNRRVNIMGEINTI